MNVRDGMDMGLEDRLKICADIGSAIMVLHAYGLLIYESVAVQARCLIKI